MNPIINYLYSSGWKDTSNTPSELRGCCPYPYQHEKGIDSRPSFSINKNTGEFNCKACGQGGKTLVSMMMYVERITKEEAIEKIYGCEQTSEKATINQVTYDFMKLAIQIGQMKKYRAIIETELTKRNLPLTCIEKYKIGFTHQRIVNKLLNDYHLIFLQKAGFLKEVSFFIKNRITIPVFSDNKLIGFSMKSTEGQEPKYYNIYNKEYFSSNYWFAFLDRSAPEVFICEGIFDAITMREYGYNACAALGTVINIERMLLLQSFETIYLVMDADKAGVNAVKKFINNSRNILDLNKIMVVTLPLNKDPDECSEDEIATFVGKAMYAFDWLIDVYTGITPPEVFIIGIKQLRKMVLNYQEDESKVLNKMIDIRMQKYLDRDIKEVYVVEYQQNKKIKYINYVAKA